MSVSCGCWNHKTPSHKKKNTNPPAAHLLLKSNVSTLEGSQTDFEILIENEQETAANLQAYNLKIIVKNEGGLGSFLEYADITNTSRQVALITHQPLSHFFSPSTLTNHDTPLKLPCKLYPLNNRITKITITINLEHQDQKDKTPPITVVWNRLPPVTNQMIQAAQNNGSTYLAEMLTNIQQRGTVHNINQPGSNGYTALHQAAHLGDTTILRTLLERGADPNIMDSNYGYAPLHYAAVDGNLPMVQELIAKGANVHVKTTDGTTPLICLMRSNKPDAPEIAKLFIEKLTPEQLNEKNTDGQTALFWAIRGGRNEMVTELLQKLDLHQIREKGPYNPILCWAINHDRTDVALVLVEHGTSSQLNKLEPASPFVPLDFDNTNLRPLDYAIKKNNDIVALKLIEKLTVEQLNQINTNRYTYLQEAVIQNNLKIAEELIKKGVDRNVPAVLTPTPAMKRVLTAP